MHERGRKGIKETANRSNAILEGAFLPWVLSDSMEYSSEAKNRYKNQHSKNKENDKEGKHHISNIMYSVSSLMITGGGN